MSNIGGANQFSYTLMDIFFFFFAGATAPPRDNVAPPLNLKLVSYIKTLMYIVSFREIQYNSFSISNKTHFISHFSILNSHFTFHQSFAF